MERAAFEELFEQQFDAVHGYLARRVGPDVGRDLAAETFVQAFANRRRFDPRRGQPRAWLFGIAHNLLRHHYRDERRRLQALSRLEDARDGDPLQEPRLAAALAALSVEERDVLLLFAWAELSYDEIAESLAVPVGTVRSRLYRARLRLRDTLTREEALDG
jgi:RNA polymerase sigma factor (sigma-70 family)